MEKYKYVGMGVHKETIAVSVAETGYRRLPESRRNDQGIRPGFRRRKGGGPVPPTKGVPESLRSSVHERAQSRRIFLTPSQAFTTRATAGSIEL